MLHHLKEIKNATDGAIDYDLTQGGHDWLAADGVGAGNNAIQADITAAIDANSLALLEDYEAARATVAGGGGPHPALTVAKALA